jgi:hypothetical protein
MFAKEMKAIDTSSLKDLTPEEKHMHLGWEILEHKWRYYVGVEYPQVQADIIPDAKYDVIEAEYINLCVQLGREEYSNSVGFPHQRASARLVDDKMRKLYGINERPFWEKKHGGDIRSMV